MCWSRLFVAVARTCCACALLVSLLLLGPPATAAELTVGVLAPRGEGRALSEWAGTVRYLNQVLPGYRFTARVFDMDGMTAAVADAEIDFVITKPSHYIALGTPHELSWLATARPWHDGPPSEAVASALLVRADSPFDDPAQLRGRTVGAVHPESLCSFLIIHPVLRERGIVPARDFRLRYLGYPSDELLYQLDQGLLDGAIVPACLLERMVEEGAVAPSRFRVLIPHDSDHPCASSTEWYPGWSFAALGHVPADLAAAVAHVLLEPDNGSDRAWAAPTSLARVERLLSDLELHPLKPSLRTQLRATVVRYWHYSVLALLLVLAALLHYLWLQQLALRRSRELARTTQELRERERQLAKAQRLSLLGELATSLAHELNQPLTAIRSYAQGCALRLAAHDGNRALLPILDRIDAEAARGAAVVGRARDWLRREPELQELRVADVLRDLIRFYAADLRAHAVRVRLDVRPPDLRVRAERVALEQVLGNLLSNSLQAYRARDGSGPIHIHAEALAGRVQIRLRDRAGGFPPEQLEEPFRPFRSTRSDGLGLGLVLCESLMRTQGGSLKLGNAGSGAEVTLTLQHGEEQ